MESPTVLVNRVREFKTRFSLYRLATGDEMPGEMEVQIDYT
jgi:hypothetical protein